MNMACVCHCIAVDGPDTANVYISNIEIDNDDKWMFISLVFSVFAVNVFFPRLWMPVVLQAQQNKMYAKSKMEKISVNFPLLNN